MSLFDEDISTYPHRTICDVLREMRELYKTCNFGLMPSLIEEVQILGNRMEARLDAQKTYFETRDDIRKAKIELVSLKKDIKKRKKK